MKKIIIAGIGPGSPDDITQAVTEALHQATAVVGYKYYFQFVRPWLTPGCTCIDTGMKHERERAEQAFQLAEQGHTVVVISSGDGGIYGMAPLVFEMKHQRGSDVEVSVLPGISAFQKAASLLGAPIGHDLCLISLSDLMTPWALIEKRIRAAAMADFVTAVYNPKSNGRYWQLYRLKELFLQEGRSPHTPVGYVRQAGRPEQEVTMTTLADLDPEQIDMFTVLIIGNSQSYVWQPAPGTTQPNQAAMITPRGYYRDEPAENTKPGQQIMMQSFRTILHELKGPQGNTCGCSANLSTCGSGSSNFSSSGNGTSGSTNTCGTSGSTTTCGRVIGGFPADPPYPLGHLWALLHAIHTTADFDMEHLLHTDPGAVEALYQRVKEGTLNTIVTDVTMVTAGIRKGALQRLGIEAKCYLSDPRVAQMAATDGITRTQAGIRLAVAEHPDALFAFGNAPTALMELCDLMRKGKARPAGIIAAPVGFVHVCESKHMVKTFGNIPKLIVQGRKGGSNLAATLCNAILTFDDAQQLKPGRDL